jgi:hypothetical protein
MQRNVTHPWSIMVWRNHRAMNRLMGNKAVTLDQENLHRLILRLGWRDTDALPDEEAYVLEQVRRFFTANLHLARYATDIEELTLIPRGGDKPPQAEVRIIYHHRLYRLTSDENGHVPHFRC